MIKKLLLAVLLVLSLVAICQAIDTLFSQTLNTGSSGWTTYTIRSLIDNSYLSGSANQVRVTLRSDPASGEACTINAAYLGHQGAGDAYDFDGNQKQLLFSGSGSVTIATNSTVTSDWVDFTYDETKNIILSAYFNTGTADDFARINAAPWVAYYKLANDPATTDASGYTTYTDNLLLIQTIEGQTTAAPSGKVIWTN